MEGYESVVRERGGYSCKELRYLRTFKGGNNALRKQKKKITCFLGGKWCWWLSLRFDYRVFKVCVSLRYREVGKEEEEEEEEGLGRKELGGDEEV